MLLILWLTLPLHTFGFVGIEMRRDHDVHPGCTYESTSEAGSDDYGLVVFTHDEMHFWDCTNVPDGIYPQ